MTVTLVLPTRIAADIDAATAEPLEKAGVLLASVVRSDKGSARLLAREMHWVEPSAYVERSIHGLSIRSTGYVHTLGLAERMDATALWVHTHPGQGATPLPSGRDKIVDSEISSLFRLRSGSRFYGAAIFSPGPSNISFSAYLEENEKEAAEVDRLWIVGDRFTLIRAFGSRQESLLPAFDRNVRAFGGAVQQTLGDLHVGIVGVGGIGSVVAEQLLRLGVRRFTLADPDTLSDTNVTRVYGSASPDVGRAKVDVICAHLSRIYSDVHIEHIQGSLTMEAVARRFAECDVLFGCTDDNAGRLVLSRMATYLLIPVIDCGVLLTSVSDGHVAGIDGRITVLTPGAACLVCRGRIDPQRAAAELLTNDELSRRVDEGYAPALGTVEPAVVAFTTAVGAAAVIELLERLIGFGPEPRPSEVLLRFHEREVSTNSMRPKPGHYCDPNAGKIGRGVTSPFLDQTWPG
jgi:molybdopterin/thiamine biosynthesis adenylyltransferase